jgi:15-cis-phytoene synthase
VNDEGALAAAYGSCETITRAHAANFFYGIRLLSRERRRAMCAVYAFARRVDDIGDGELARKQKLVRLDAEARSLAALHAGAAAPPGGPADPVLFALADVSGRFALPVSALEELIEGVRMDVQGVTYETFEELVPYCRRVAGAIGRVCLAVFGLREEQGADRARAEALADDLGVAMQLTNILRDVREDAENGRVYLPAEDLRRFAVIASGAAEPRGGAATELLGALARAGAHADGAHAAIEQRERLSALVRFEAARAHEWFARGLALVPLLDRRSGACVLAMAGIYRRLLARMEADPEQAVSRRISLPAREKAWVVARCVLGAGA